MKNDKVLDLDNLVDDVTDRKIFLGTYSGFQRYDVYKYPFAKNIEIKMRNAFWNPNEISMVSDRIKFPTMPDHAQEIITLNLLFQTLMDSAQSRGLEMVLCELTTSPEWEAVFKTQAYFEQIHSISYSHIVREVYPDATTVFDRIRDIPEIQHRIDKEINGYNFFLSSDYENLDDTGKKKLIIELIIRIYILEAMKFYVSFLVTYVINNSYSNSIQGISKIIKLINFDEDMHVIVMSSLLMTMKKNKDEGFSEIMNSDWFPDKVREIMVSVVKDEIEWGDFLLSHGDVPTLTAQVIEKFTKWWADERMVKIGLEPIYNVQKIDVVDWFNSYRDVDLDNVAGQETEALAYNVGIMQNDIPEGKLKL